MMNILLINLLRYSIFKMFPLESSKWQVTFKNAIGHLALRSGFQQLSTAIDLASSV